MGEGNPDTVDTPSNERSGERTRGQKSDWIDKYRPAVRVSKSSGRPVAVLITTFLVAAAFVPLVASLASATAPAQTANLGTGHASDGILYDSGQSELVVADPGTTCGFDTIPVSTFSPTFHSLSSLGATVCPKTYNSSISYDASGWVYVAATPNEMVVVDDSTNGLTNSFSTAAYGQPFASTLDSSGDTFFSVSGSSSTAHSYVIELSGGSQVGSAIDIGAGTAQAIGYNPNNGDLYVYRLSSSTITYLHLSTPGSMGNITGVSGVSPDGFAYDPTNNEMYAAEGTTGSTVYVISGSNALSSITVGTSPYALAWVKSAGEMAVTNQGSGSVSFFLPFTNSVARTVSTGTSPTLPLYDPVTGNLYVTDEGANNVLVVSPLGSYVVDSDGVGAHSFGAAFDSGDGIVDVGSDASTSVWSLPAPRTMLVGSSPVAMAGSSATNDLYVANSGSGNVSVVQPDNSAVSSLTVGTTPDAVVYDSTHHDIAVANYGSDTISVISSSNTVSATISLGVSATEPVAMAFDSSNGFVYVADNGSNTVSVINLGTGTVTATIPVGSHPMAIVYDSTHNEVYVANYGGGSVTAITGTTVSATIAVGSQPSSIAVSPDGYVAVTNSGSGTVSIIYGNSLAVTTTTWTGTPYPTAIAWGAGQGEFIVLFRTAGDDAKVSTGGTRAATASLGAGSEPSSLTSDSYSGNVYVTLWGSNEVDVLGPGTAAGLIGTFSVGTQPTGAYYDPVTGEYYIANEGGGSVTDV